MSRVGPGKGWEVTANGSRGSFWGDENILKLTAVMVANSINILKPLNCII